MLTLPEKLLSAYEKEYAQLNSSQLHNRSAPETARKICWKTHYLRSRDRLELHRARDREHSNLLKTQARHGRCGQTWCLRRTKRYQLIRREGHHLDRGKALQLRRA